MAISPAFAASSDVKLEKAELSLLDGGRQADGHFLAGVEIRLQTGVKTYWRMPGESGLPPIFDFSRSDNVESVEIKWPAPSRFEEADGTILGFKDRVIFPLIVKPKNPAAAVTLTVGMDFGICDTLCLPAQAVLQRALSPNAASGTTSRIDEFLARVPNSASVKGAVKPALLSLTPDDKTLTLIFASDAPLHDVILETEGSWFFGNPVIVPDGAGLYRATLAIEQKPKEATLAGLVMTVTALSENGSTETSLTLDASGSIR